MKNEANTAAPAAPATFDRGRDTRRREKAVEAMLADGWRWDGKEWVRPPATPAPVAGDAVRTHVECRHCDDCNHAGINDEHATLAACLSCDWSGPSPTEDRCPGCARENCMSAACPKCGCRYELMASTEVAPLAQHRASQGAVAAPHADDVAVDRLAAAMKEKLSAARDKGRGGWENREDCPQQRLSEMLRAHVEKGDPRDVANFCMMLHQRGESILPQPEAAPGVPEGWALVPVEPTFEMIMEGADEVSYSENSDEDNARNTYITMLAAAPKPTAGEQAHG